MYEKRSENNVLFNNGVFPVIISDFQNESIMRVNSVFTDWFHHRNPDISVISINGDRFKVLDQLRREGICENFSLTVTHSNGKKIPCRATASIAVSSRDTEEILIIIHGPLYDKTKTANLYALSENIETIFWAVDTQMNLVNFNSRFIDSIREAYGFTVKIGDNIIRKQPEQLEVPWSGRYDTALSGKKVKYTDNIFGRILETTMAPIYSEYNDIIGICCTMNNISEKIITETNLKVTSERLSGICNSPTDAAIIITDQQGIICQFNDGAVRMLGYSRGEIIGKINIQKLFSDDFLTEVRLFINSKNGDQISNSDLLSYLSNHSDLISQKDWFFMDKGNRSIDIKISISSVLMDNGEFTGIMLIAQDISELNRIKEQLIYAKNHAEEISKTKTSFLANMSHEIRTPLNGIIGMTDLLTRTDLSPEQENYTSIVQKSADSLLLLVNDILDYSKIEAGKLSLDLISFNLRALMDDIKDILLINIQERNIDFGIRIDPSVPEDFIGDPGKIKQILLNLISNALKFTLKGYIRIEIYQVGESGRNITLYFKVIDTGIGISGEEKEKLFQSFSQVDISTTRKYGGSGLGLAISRKLVTMMDGEIGVDSGKGQGSTFWFTISLIKELGESGKKNILLINSNKLSRRVLASNLRKLKFIVTAVEDSEQCMNELGISQDKGFSFDLIIIDEIIKDCTGDDLASRIRQFPSYKNAKLIKTSYNNETESEYFDSFIQFPVNRELMVKTLEEMYYSGTDDEAEEDLSPFVTEKGKKRKKLVLLAEDNKINQLVAIKFLKKLGYDVDLAENGREAVDAYNQKYYDLILMDHMMPVMDGIEATREIRKSKSVRSNKNIIIIAITANAMKGDRDMLIESGMNDYISKPVLLKDMKAVLEKNLKK